MQSKVLPATILVGAFAVSGGTGGIRKVARRKAMP